MKYLKKISLVSALFALALTFSVSAAQAQDTTEVPQPETYMVKGKVVDAQTMDVLADAAIIIVGKDIATTADTEGKFKLENLPAGIHTIKVEAEGYQVWEKELKLNQDTELSVKLEPEPTQ